MSNSFDNKADAQMKYCPNCGSAVKSDASFCPNCGGRVAVNNSNEKPVNYASSQAVDDNGYDFYSMEDQNCNSNGSQGFGQPQNEQARQGYNGYDPNGIGNNNNAYYQPNMRPTSVYGEKVSTLFSSGMALALMILSIVFVVVSLVGSRGIGLQGLFFVIACIIVYINSKNNALTEKRFSLFNASLIFKMIGDCFSLLFVFVGIFFINLLDEAVPGCPQSIKDLGTAMCVVSFITAAFGIVYNIFGFGALKNITTSVANDNVTDNKLKTFGIMCFISIGLAIVTAIVTAVFANNCMNDLDSIGNWIAGITIEGQVLGDEIATDVVEAIKTAAVDGFSFSAACDYLASLLELAINALLAVFMFKLVSFNRFYLNEQDRMNNNNY